MNNTTQTVKAALVNVTSRWSLSNDNDLMGRPVGIRIDFAGSFKRDIATMRTEAAATASALRAAGRSVSVGKVVATWTGREGYRLSVKVAA